MLFAAVFTKKNMLPTRWWK